MSRKGKEKRMGESQKAVPVKQQPFQPYDTHLGQVKAQWAEYVAEDGQVVAQVVADAVVGSAAVAVAHAIG